MYIFLALTLLVPMLALRRRADGDTNILDSKSTTCIKGVLCIYVLLHNLGLDIANTKLEIIVFEHAGGVGVGLFFFLSAYGIIRAYQQRGNTSLIHLLFKHIPKMWLLAVFINAITYFTFMRGDFESGDMWMRILNLDIFNGFKGINRHGWYIATIIALYIVFAIVYFACSKLKTDKKFIIAMCIMIAIAIGLRLTAIITDTARLYTRELPAFAIGCFYATFYNKINEFASKYFKIGLILSVVAFIFGFYFSEPVATYAATVIVVFVSQKFTYYSRVTYFLGKICLGVYLFLHYSSLTLIFYIYQEYLWILLNAGFILLVAIMIYAVQYAIDYSICKAKGWGLHNLKRVER